MSSSLNFSDLSGIYACSCGNLETHIEGNSKAPCSKCGKNNSWTKIISTIELEHYLNEYSNSTTFLDLFIRERFAKI